MLLNYVQQHLHLQYSSVCLSMIWYIHATYIVLIYFSILMLNDLGNFLDTTRYSETPIKTLLTKQDLLKE
jgi:hypothetical protein